MNIISKDYEDIRSSISSLDIILFAGTDFVSKSIRYLQKRRLGLGDFSHVGLILKADILDKYNLDPDKLYVWESTSSYKEKNNDVLKQKSSIGVQLRDFDEVIKNYRGKVVWGQLKDNPWIISNNKTEIKDIVESLFVKYQGRNYDFNIINLLSALYPKIRPLRTLSYKLFTKLPFKQKNYKSRIFCSELLAIVYKELNIFEKTLDVKTFVPMDVLGLDEDGSKSPLQYPLILIRESYMNSVTLSSISSTRSSIEISV